MDPEWRTGTRLAFHLLASHHPLCDVYAADVFGRRLRICSGCALTWPLAVLSFATVWFVGPEGSTALALAAAGLILGLPQATTYVYRGGRLWRGSAKAVGGAGLGVLLSAGLLSPVPAGLKMIALLGLGAAFVALQGLRMRSIVRTCRACPWRMDWAHCPGFAPKAHAGLTPGSS